MSPASAKACVWRNLLTTDSFTNVYEESKAQAEAIVSQYCENQWYTTFHPAAVYRLRAFENRTIPEVQCLVLSCKISSRTSGISTVKDILDQGGEQSRRWNISMGDDGILCLPLEFYFPNNGFVNLIPVDYFVESTLRIVEHPASEGIYHLTSDNPPDMATLIEYTERFLGVRGIRTLSDPCAENS